MWGYDYETYRTRAARLRAEARAEVLTREAVAAARHARTTRRRAARERGATGRRDGAPTPRDVASSGAHDAAFAPRDVASSGPRDVASRGRVARAVRVLLRRVRRVRAAQGVRG
ncbi:hypothetical protein [Streptomyces sp. AM 3-1-1]|uniref:hypothetical protein n=1 Tax=unclassified Streptomyces TaxID=2593676 RepID=UPI0023BA2E5C|nr:hypothetical protein [Streptomyces sp. AM 3-1-1]WEH29955.1 hypothetical protein P0D76_22975 [Streptomyces sp. AM 3-1-1]